jgi:glutaredoxin
MLNDESIVRSNHRVVIYLDAKRNNIYSIRRTMEAIKFFNNKVRFLRLGLSVLTLSLSLSISISLSLFLVSSLTRSLASELLLSCTMNDCVQGIPDKQILMINVSDDRARQEWLREQNPRNRSFEFPQIFIGDIRVGVRSSLDGR